MNTFHRFEFPYNPFNFPPCSDYPRCTATGCIFLLYTFHTANSQRKTNQNVKTVFQGSLSVVQTPLATLSETFRALTGRSPRPRLATGYFAELWDSTSTSNTESRGGGGQSRRRNEGWQNTRYQLYQKGSKLPKKTTIELR